MRIISEFETHQIKLGVRQASAYELAVGSAAQEARSNALGTAESWAVILVTILVKRRQGNNRP